MAEPGPAGPTRDVANEGRLRAARRESPPAQPGGPSDIDEAAAQAQQMRDPRAASNEAAAQNIQRQGGQSWLGRKATSMLLAGGMALGSPAAGAQQAQDQQGEVQGGARAADRATSAFARQQRLENQLNRTRRSGISGGKSASASSVLGKGSPVGAGVNAIGGGRVKAVMMAAQALQKGGVDKTEIQQTFGRGCVKMLWQNLWFTFGHSSYFLAIIFLTTSQSRYARKWFPQVGEEWFPPDLIKKIPKAAMVPLKLAELVGLSFVLFWVILLDLACLGMFAFFLGLILTAANAV